MVDRKVLSVQEARDLLEIDQNDLDVDCATQSQLFEEVGYAHTMATSERDHVKEKMATVDAEVASEIRTSNERLNKKISEANIKEEICMHKRHKMAYETYMAGKMKVDQLAIVKESFMHRLEMLKKLADLFGKYWSTEKIKTYKGTKKLVGKGQRKLTRRD